MTAKDKVWLNVLDKPTEEHLQFLGNVKWGTEGLLYRVLNHCELLKEIGPSTILQLRSEQGVVGSLLLIKKWIHILGKRVQAVYVTQFAVAPEYRSQNPWRYFRRELDQQLNDLSASQGCPTLAYAYIEQDNLRSSSVVVRRLKWYEIGKFDGVTISRMFPKRTPMASRLPVNQVPDMVARLNSLYIDHEFLDFDTSIRAKDYWVLRTRDGRIIAGLQVHREDWQVLEMSGPDGWLAVHVLPHLPWLARRIFNAPEARFIHIGNLYVEPGKEKDLLQLVEHVLAEHKVPFGVAYLDPQSPISQRLTKQRLGTLDKLIGKKTVKIVARPIGFPNKEMEAKEMEAMGLSRKVISPMDITGFILGAIGIWAYATGASGHSMAAVSGVMFYRLMWLIPKLFSVPLISLQRGLMKYTISARVLQAA